MQVSFDLIAMQPSWACHSCVSHSQDVRGSMMYAGLYDTWSIQCIPVRVILRVIHSILWLVLLRLLIRIRFLCRILSLIHI